MLLYSVRVCVNVYMYTFWFVSERNGCIYEILRARAGGKLIKKSYSDLVYSWIHITRKHLFVFFFRLADSQCNHFIPKSIRKQSPNRLTNSVGCDSISNFHPLNIIN